MFDHFAFLGLALKMLGVTRDFLNNPNGCSAVNQNLILTVIVSSTLQICERVQGVCILF